MDFFECECVFPRKNVYFCNLVYTTSLSDIHMLQALNALRFIFAMLIFFSHVDVPGGKLFDLGGDMGVSYFFMLSGFVLFYGYRERVQEPGFSWWGFVRRRWWRVYPVHFFCWLSFMLYLGWNVLVGRTAVEDVHPGTLLANLCLLHAWNVRPEYYFSGNAVAWSLSALMFMYTVFPALCRALVRWPRAFAGCLAGVLGLYFALVPLLPNWLIHGLVYISPELRVLDFVLGMAVCSLWLGVRDRLGGGMALWTALELAACCVAAFAVWVYYDVAFWVQLASLWWVPTACVLFVFAQCRGALSRFLCLPFFGVLGELSFSFFMLHTLVIFVVGRTVDIMGWSYPLWANICFNMSCAWVLTIFVHRYVEKKITERPVWTFRNILLRG